MTESNAPREASPRDLSEALTLGDIKRRYAEIFQVGTEKILGKALEGRTEFTRYRRDVLTEAEAIIRDVADFIRGGAPELPDNDTLFRLGETHQRETLLGQGWSEVFLVYSCTKSDYEEFDSIEAATAAVGVNSKNGLPFKAFKKKHPETGNIEFLRARS